MSDLEEYLPRVRTRKNITTTVNMDPEIRDQLMAICDDLETTITAAIHAMISKSCNLPSRSRT